MTDTDSVDGQEEQDVSVDNICYMKFASKRGIMAEATPTSLLTLNSHLA